MGLFLGKRHRPICILLSLCKHACKEVCNVNPGIDPYPFLARSCDRWWPDFVTFTTCQKSRFGLIRGKKAQCVSNRCKDLFERKKYFGVRCTLNGKCSWTLKILKRRGLFASLEQHPSFLQVGYPAEIRRREGFQASRPFKESTFPVTVPYLVSLSKSVL